MKKPNLDSELMSAYRSVTNLSFLSKVVEKVVIELINLYLETNNNTSKYQSAFPAVSCSHSTKTALLKLFKDPLCYLDESRSVKYIGLHLSTTFEVNDHQFLFEIKKKWIGLQSIELLFIKKYFLNHSQQVIINGFPFGDV